MGGPKFHMKSSYFIAAFGLISLLLIAGILFREAKPDPTDLFYWTERMGERDWSAEAGQGKAEAQFFVGLGLIRSDLMKTDSRIPI